MKKKTSFGLVTQLRPATGPLANATDEEMIEEQKDKSELREQLANDVEAFLAKGGKIEHVESGVVGFDQSSPRMFTISNKR